MERLYNINRNILCNKLQRQAVILNNPTYHNLSGSVSIFHANETKLNMHKFQHGNGIIKAQIKHLDGP